MKKIFEYLGLAAFIIFSFYYTEKAALFVQNKNPIMQSIRQVEESSAVKAVDATIEDNTIIPGLYGKEVNVSKSFQTMKSFGVFNEYYLVYDNVMPTISLKDNKDKVIISGNPTLRRVAIVIDNDPKIVSYFQKSAYFISALATLENYNSDLEMLNSESKLENFRELDNKLTTKNINPHICMVNTNVNIQECQQKKYYLVKPTITLTSNNIATIKNSLTNGAIIFITKGTSITDIEILLNQIKYQGLDLVYLSELIRENQNQ